MTEKTSRKVPGTTAWAMAGVGAVLMVVGMFAAKNGVFTGIEKPIADMGIPLELGKTISTIGVLMILFKVIEGFFFNPLHESIDHRTGELERTFTEAESLRADMTQMKADYEKRLVDTEASAREQIQAQIKEAQDLKKSLMADAQRQADDYKQTAIAEIEAEKRKVLGDLRVEVTKLSLQATEKLLGANIDSDRNRKLIDEFLSTVEVKN